MKKPSITIFGLGRVGSALEKSLTKAGYDLISVFNSNAFPKAKEELGDLVFLTVRDSEIAPLSKKIATSFTDLKNIMFVHCSGSLDASVLLELTKCGAKTASFHPLKAVTKNNHSLEHVWFDMDGDKEVLKALEEIAQNINAYSFEVNAEAKPLLHAAAVVSSNYVVTLMKLATEVAEKGNIDSEIALKALIPLMESSVSNIKEKGFKKALTGPIARGDVETVERHVKFLKSDSELLSLYKKLGSLTVEIADLDTDSKKKLLTLLS